MAGYPAAPVHVRFTGSTEGQWRIDGVEAVIGEALAPAARLAVTAGPQHPAGAAVAWQLSGFTSNTRYTEAGENAQLQARQAGLARPEATSAAMIAIRKTPAWWAMAQDERRAVFEAQSRHIAIGMDYLPNVARRLHHSRDLGEAFDFITWFEFAPADTEAFDAMLVRLRATPEWRFIDREVDVRLSSAGDEPRP